VELNILTNPLSGPADVTGTRHGLVIANDDEEVMDFVFITNTTTIHRHKQKLSKGATEMAA
jgi:hypothetical protein